MAEVKEQLVFFDPIEHKYTDREGNRLISVSQLLSLFKPKFDPTGEITAKYAKKHGMTVAEVLDKWKQINTQSCTYGTSVHEEIEHYINTKEIRSSDHIHYVNQFAEIKFQGRLFSERMLYCLDNMVAGTADIVERIGFYINIWDFKTNKELSKFNNFGGRMLYDLSHLSDCNFNHYQLQLSLYGYLCELKGLKVNDLIILYMNPKTLKMEFHRCRYMRDEVKYILETKDTLWDNQKILS
jgi:hypothetical protein